MKRLISPALVAVLLLCCTTGAMAAQYDENDASADTYVYMTIEEEANEPSYTVSIPAEVEMIYGNGMSTDAEIVAEEVEDIGDQKIVVSVVGTSSNNTFALWPEGASGPTHNLRFMINGSPSIPSSTGALNVASFTEPGTETMTFRWYIMDHGIDPGTYSCTLTYGIGLADIE